MPSRRKTREFVLQVLFASDARKQDPLKAYRVLRSHFAQDEEQVVKVHRVQDDFASELLQTLVREQTDIDNLIASVSRNWKLSRMNRVDRNILRMAIAEMIHFPNTPVSVILNEAIDLGKRYGAEHSSSFINGVLDRIGNLGDRPASAKRLTEHLTALDEPGSTV